MDAMIRTTPALAAACAQCRAEGLLALDTEFVWSRTYLPQLGLVQLGCRSACWTLDCLTGTHTEPLAELLADAGVVKILHDARQDLVILRHYAEAEPKNVFDTQLAAAFAGFPSGRGLQSLLFETLDVGLAKTETLTDWLRRPLTAAQIGYALDDVRYLPALRDELLKRATALGTADWLAEDLARFDDPGQWRDHAPSEMWKRIKTGRARLGPRGRAVLQAVAALREEMARELNLPRNWLGDDASLTEMAVQRRVGRLAHRVNGGQAVRVRSRYEQAIAAALELPEEACPENPHPHYIPEVLAAADKALEWLRARAAEIHVDAAAIATRATVTAFVDNVDDASNPLAGGWRHAAVGREMAGLFGVD